jgi:hypothetical protein
MLNTRRVGMAPSITDPVAFMNLYTLSAAQQWLDGVRSGLATLGSAPSVPLIETLAAQLADRAMQPDAPRSLARRNDAAPAPGYRRHQIAGGVDVAQSCLLIEWPAAHRTPIHDHAGLWGIELVLDGVLEVEEFATGGDLDQPVLTRGRTLILGVGDAAVFTGRRYAHRCRNLSTTRPALSLHVYGGVLDRYHAFHPDPRGRYSARAQQARVDATLSV